MQRKSEFWVMFLWRFYDAYTTGEHVWKKFFVYMDHVEFYKFIEFSGSLLNRPPGGKVQTKPRQDGRDWPLEFLNI